jgi:hypothetical protein
MLKRTHDELSGCRGDTYNLRRIPTSQPGLETPIHVLVPPNRMAALPEPTNSFQLCAEARALRTNPENPIDEPAFLERAARRQSSSHHATAARKPASRIGSRPAA